MGQAFTPRTRLLRGCEIGHMGAYRLPLLLATLGIAGIAFWAGAVHGGHRAMDRFVEFVVEERGPFENPNDRIIEKYTLLMGLRWSRLDRTVQAARVAGGVGAALLLMSLVWRLRTLGIGTSSRPNPDPARTEERTCSPSPATHPAGSPGPALSAASDMGPSHTPEKARPSQEAATREARRETRSRDGAQSLNWWGCTTVFLVVAGAHVALWTALGAPVLLSEIGQDPIPAAFILSQPACAIVGGIVAFGRPRTWLRRAGVFLLVSLLGYGLEVSNAMYLRKQFDYPGIVREMNRRGGPRNEEERWLYEVADFNLRPKTAGYHVASFAMDSIPLAQAFLIAGALAVLARRKLPRLSKPDPGGAG